MMLMTVLRSVSEATKRNEALYKMLMSGQSRSSTVDANMLRGDFGLERLPMISGHTAQVVHLLDQ